NDRLSENVTWIHPFPEGKGRGEGGRLLKPWGDTTNSSNTHRAPTLELPTHFAETPPMSETVQLRDTLKKYFGFTSFRPLQEDIIRDTLAGKDVFAVLPTGGGKSLCFQLPALVRPGLTVVISPLIALIKDQVVALQAAGVAATFLNSSLATEESRARLRGLHNGEYRLLYVAPERL